MDVGTRRVGDPPGLQWGSRARIFSVSGLLSTSVEVFYCSPRWQQGLRWVEEHQLWPPTLPLPVQTTQDFALPLSVFQGLPFCRMFLLPCPMGSVRDNMHLSLSLGNELHSTVRECCLLVRKVF